MLTKKTIIAIVLVAVITVGILVPVLILTSQPPVDNSPPTLQIIAPINTRYFSQTSQVNIDLASPDSNIDTLWYRLYNETDGSWFDPTNVTWTGLCQRALGNGGIYTLYAWANDTLGRISSMQSVTFTMYLEIIHSGNHIFSSDFTIETYQKVIFQNGAFSFTSGILIVSGILAMYNVTWTSALNIYGNSEGMGTNITFNAAVYSYGNLVASLNNITFLSGFDLLDNSSITLTDVVFTSALHLYDSTKLTVCRASLVGFISYEFSMVNISDSALALNGIAMHDWSSVTLRDCSNLPIVTLLNNASLNLVNTSLDQLYLYLNFQTGNWSIDHNIISGTGTYTAPRLTRIDSTVAYIITDLRIWGTTNILLKDGFFSNPTYSYLRGNEYSNITLDNTTIGYIYMNDYSNATIVNSTIISELNLKTNGTIYLEEVSIGTIVHGFYFTEGNIVGYNETFAGAISWRFPKITLGPNVDYSNYRYYYELHNQVNFTLTNTSKVQSLYAFDFANATVLFFNAPTAQVYMYGEASIALYYSRLNYLVGYNQVNITVFNSTCARHSLSQTASSRVIANSHIGTLYLYHLSTYYLSPDSKIDITYDYR